MCKNQVMKEDGGKETHIFAKVPDEILHIWDRFPQMAMTANDTNFMGSFWLLANISSPQAIFRTEIQDWNNRVACLI